MSLHYRYPQIVRPPELVPNTLGTAGEEDKARLRGPLSYFFFRYLLWPESCHALVSADRGPWHMSPWEVTPLVPPRAARGIPTSQQVSVAVELEQHKW